MQTDVYRLLDQLSEQRSPPRDISEHVIHEAHTRLEEMYRTVCRKVGPFIPTAELVCKLEQAQTSETVELAKILESLVAENESLKRDNTEMQNLLAEARTEHRALTEEVCEYRAAAFSSHASMGQNLVQSEGPNSPRLPLQLIQCLGLAPRLRLVILVVVVLQY